MKKLLTILFCVISLNLSATNYYVKTGGSDAADGQSDANAWATISKVNTVWAAGTFAPGDSILFNRGNTFDGTIEVTESGTSGNYIVIGAYGTGDKPIINGLTTVTGWSVYSGSIENKTVSTESTPQILLTDGVNTPYGRWPKTEYALIDLATSTSIVDNELPSSPDYDGATAVIRTRQWVIEKRTVTHNNQTLTFSATTYTTDEGYGYFIQNDLDVLTQAYDWAYLSGDLYYYDPGTKVIKIPVIDNLIEIDGYDYIKIINLQLEGANRDAVYLANADYISIEDCDILNCGGYGVRGTTAITRVTVDDNTFDEINNMAVRLAGSYITVTNNEITNIGTYPGMGYIATGDLDHALSGIEVTGVGNHLISINTLDTIGYDGISFGGVNTEVSYNTIGNWCFVKDDGGGIYSYRDNNMGKVVKYNFVYNGIGVIVGEPDADNSTHGIYNDGSINTLYTYNVCWNNGTTGLFVNDCGATTVTYNTLYDNDHTQLMILVDQEETNYANYNICVARTKIDTWTQSCMAIILRGVLDWTDYGTTDYNYYARPINDDDYIETWYDAWEWRYDNRQIRNLSEWQTLSGQDTNSEDTPETITSDDELHFIYNNSASAVSYTLSAPMVDAKNALYDGEIELAAWSALILIGEGTVTLTGETPPSGNVFAKDKTGKFMKDSSGKLMMVE